MVDILTQGLTSQFTYWDMQRSGQSQAEIAEAKQVSRQAVSKAIKAQEYRVMEMLLELAQSIGALVEWHDHKKGVLVGQITQLDGMACLIVVDRKDQLKVVYDNDDNLSDELLTIISDIFSLQIQANQSFADVITSLVNL